MTVYFGWTVGAFLRAFQINMAVTLSELKDAGVSDYSIHLDEETYALIGVLWRTEDHKMNELPSEEIMQRWWSYMADIMETYPNNEPVVVPLKTMFHMP